MWLQDIRFALRLLRKEWVFSSVAIVILALCVGANSAVLSIVNAAMVRPLAYPEPSRLLHLVTIFPNDPSGYESSVDGVTWELVRERVPALKVAVYGGGFGGGVNLAVNGAAVFVRQGRVSAGFFSVLGIPPFIGRGFSAAEDRTGGPNAVILSYPLWQKYFSGDPHVLGRSILLLGASYTVVGVMPRGFEWAGTPGCGCSSDELWTPLRPSTTGEGSGSNYGMIARLQPGATIQQAKTQLDALTPAVRERGSYGPDSHVRVDVVALQQAMTQDLSQPLQLLWIAVGGIILLGCVNIGGMLLARVSSRSSEFTTRMALGATPGGIQRQLLVESLMLGTCGGIAGLGIGYAGLAELRNLGQRAFPFLRYVNLDWRVVVATIFLALLTAVAFGMFPAWHAARSDPRLAQAGARTIAGRNRHFSLGAMVSAQVALAIALLMAAVLLLRAFLFLWNFPAGFNAQHVIAAQFSLQDARYDTAEKVNHLYETVIQKLDRTPGIESAAAALTLPYQRALNGGFQLAGETQAHTTNEAYVTAGYFATLRIPILQGKSFTEADGPNAAPVAIVNESFVSHYVKGRAVLGAELLGGSGPRRIIGVVGNAVGGNPGWGSFAPVSDYPEIFIPAAQTNGKWLAAIHVWFSPSWVVRSRLPASDAAQALISAVHQADPLLPAPVMLSFDELKTRALGQQRLIAWLVDVLAALAVLLAALGIYGLVANLVAERTREMGIRIALGSTSERAMWTALAPSMRWVAIGAVGGALVTFGLDRLLRSFLFGVRPGDPLSLLIVTFGFLAVTAISSLIPALRILKIPLSDTLRAE